MWKILLTLLLLPASPGSAHARTEKYPSQTGDTGLVSELSWSPDDQLILTSSGEDNGLRLWDVAAGRVLWKANVGFLQDDAEHYAVHRSAWTADGKFVSTGTQNGKIQLWEAATGRLVWNVKAHAEDVELLAVSPGAKTLVSSSATEDGGSDLKVWNLADGRLVKDLGANQGALRALGFVDDARFRTGDLSGRIKVWSAEDFETVSEKSISPCGGGEKVGGEIEYGAGFNLVAARCRAGFVITNVGTGKVLARIPREDGDSMGHFSRDERFFFLPESQIFDIRAGELKEFEQFGRGVLSGDGGLVAAFPSYRAEGVQIFETRTGARRGWLVGHPGVIKSLAFSPDGGLFASGSADRVVRVWDSRNRTLLHLLEGHTGAVESVEFGEGGRTLTSRSEKETIVWDVGSGLKLGEVKGKNEFEKYGNRVLSPSGRLALVEEYDKPLRLVDAATGATLKEFGRIDQLDSTAFCPDEKCFLTKPWWGGWQLREMEGGRPVREFDLGYSFHNAVAFHPDGRTFVTGGEGQNIFMFDLGSDEALWSLLPVDRKEFEEKKAWEARRVAWLKRRSDNARRADSENAAYAHKVYVAFSHYGDMTAPGEMRMVESGRPDKSKSKKSAADADAVWLRLRNDSPLPVKIPTHSFYLPDKKCFHEFPDGRKLLGLCDGTEINAWLGLEDKDGEHLPYGFDFGSSAYLLPKKSVLFAVPRAVLGGGNVVRFGFVFQKAVGGKIVDHGTEQILRFRESDLPKR